LTLPGADAAVIAESADAAATELAAIEPQGITGDAACEAVDTAPDEDELEAADAAQPRAQGLVARGAADDAD
jgi:hypothetical protein